MRAPLLTFAVGIVSLAPSIVFAHETRHFRIGEKEYMFVVGSLNEPVTVDDKSGVELMVSLVPPDGAMPGDPTDASRPHDHDAATPVTGLEQTVKVEISAAAKKKTLDLSPQYGRSGAYKAVFIPTVPTTLTYRFFGTVDGNAIDLSFSCNPAGHPATPEDTAEQQISDTVTRTLKTGAFGCPMAKAALGFPEPAPSLLDLQGGPRNGQSMKAGWIGAILGAIGFALGGIAFARARH